jgi:hypothetical protein
VTEKRSYTRRGPVGVVHQNVAAVLKHAHLAAARLDAWADGSDDPVLTTARALALQVRDEASALVEDVERLVSSGFVPPERDTSLRSGELVAVKPEHRRRYEGVVMVLEDPGALDLLTVDKVLDTGEVLVRRSGKAPFPARRSHLVRIRSEEGRRDDGSSAR